MLRCPRRGLGAPQPVKVAKRMPGCGKSMFCLGSMTISATTIPCRLGRRRQTVRATHHFRDPTSTSRGLLFWRGPRFEARTCGQKARPEPHETRDSFRSVAIIIALGLYFHLVTLRLNDDGNAFLILLALCVCVCLRNLPDRRLCLYRMMGKVGKQDRQACSSFCCGCRTKSLSTE